ncbi:MAG TPA: MGMT family protein [Myxococcota bacterium]|nr:MGMT family protein [Myxococcota bacterium]
MYRVVRLIPEGLVLSYGDVAAAIGSPGAARQVGWALAGLCEGGIDKEGVVVPWQRVVRTSGHIAFAGDPIRGDLQRALLQEEGVEFIEDRIPMRRFRWDPDIEDLC